jgi:lysophospholipase L1-like esterase
LSHFWSRRVDIVNRGFSGYNSRWGLSIIEEVVISLRPDMVLIFFGANDAVVAGGSTYVSLNEYEENIEKMITVIGKVIVVISRSKRFSAYIVGRCIVISSSSDYQLYSRRRCL